MSNPLDGLRDNHSDFNKNQDSFAFNDPLMAFENWFNGAIASNEPEANAMVLSTVNEVFQPSSRIVYLKELNHNLFVFYTNYHSQKGKDLDFNPKASLLFFWPGLERQIRIEGEITRVSTEESDAYFASRPRESQLGAWASHQSETLESMEEIMQRFTHFEKLYQDTVPRPSHWGGFALNPSKMEFWQGKPSRLHERTVFVKNVDQWSKYHLNP